MNDEAIASGRAFMRVAMATAGIMVAHQVAAKAYRDAAFLTVWPATALVTARGDGPSRAAS